MSQLSEETVERAAEMMKGGAPVAMVEPEEDELGDVPPQFVSNGWIRMTVNGTRHKLRRPYFGEMEQLEAAMDTHRRELTMMHDAMQEEIAHDVVRSKEIQAATKKLNGKDPDRKMELDNEATALGVKAMERHDQIMRESARLRSEWWRLAFKLLTPEPYTVPQQLPAFVTDPMLQTRVVQHWQSVPLAPGSE